MNLYDQIPDFEYSYQTGTPEWVFYTRHLCEYLSRLPVAQLHWFHVNGSILTVFIEGRKIASWAKNKNYSWGLLQVLTLLKVIDQKSYNLNQDRFWKCLKILIQILSTQTKFWEIECRIKHLLYLSTNEKTNQFCNWSFLWIYMIKFLILSTHTRLVLQNGYFTLVTYASTSAGFQLLNFTDSMWMEAF